MKFARLALLAAATVPPPLLAADATPPAATTEKATPDRAVAIAHYNLGLAYAQGRQGAPDAVVEAYVWLTLAAEAGADRAALDGVGKIISPEQLAAARRRLEALRAVSPFFRPPVAPPASRPETPAPTPTPGGNEARVLREQLAGLERDKTQLATDLATAAKSLEDLKTQLANRPDLREELTRALSELRQTQANLAQQSTDLAAARVTATQAQAELATARASLATQEVALKAAADGGRRGNEDDLRKATTLAAELTGNSDCGWF